jgi:hypothetical protein
MSAAARNPWGLDPKRDRQGANAEQLAFIALRDELLTAFECDVAAIVSTPSALHAHYTAADVFTHVINRPGHHNHLLRVLMLETLAAVTTGDAADLSRAKRDARRLLVRIAEKHSEHEILNAEQAA